jgi:hypothetical protein
MSSIARDGKKQRRREGPRPYSSARLIAGLAGCGLLSVTWACTERTATRASPETRAQTVTAGSSAASPPSSPPRVESTRARTTHGQMVSHYGDTAAMRRALVAGKLADYQAAADALARDEWWPSATADAPAFLKRVRAAAADAHAAPSLVAAASALGALADVCASCHLASGAPEFPIAPEEPSEAQNPRMLAHAIASDRLWAGLILPSDESWVSGAKLLADVPALDAPSAEVSAAARLLGELARRGETAELEQRAQIFCDVMLTCSGCHERLGVVLAEGAVVR